MACVFIVFAIRLRECVEVQAFIKTSMMPYKAILPKIHQTITGKIATAPAIR